MKTLCILFVCSLLAALVQAQEIKKAVPAKATAKPRSILKRNDPRNKFPDDWETYRKKLRRQILDRMGFDYPQGLPLEFQVLDSRVHCGITIQNVIYQTRPGVWNIALLYLPEGKGPFPAVLSMHGHTRHGRLTPRVQTRGMAMAKQGYVVLSPDGFGQGERGTVHGRFANHGNVTGLQCFNIGESLMGCLLVDNMRSIDVLMSLPQVDKTRIGATGVSGGGNQTMYLAAMDERVKAAVPVCSVGSYASYLYNRNCVCEVMPDGLSVTEMAGVLALTAPRAMLICTGLYDVQTFSPHDMLNSYEAALPIFKKYNVWDKFSYRIFNHGHVYSPEALEAMLGFFELHLKDKGRGAPMALASFTTLPLEDLMAFKPGKRPAKVHSLAEYAVKRGNELKKQSLARKEIDAKKAVADLACRLKLDKNLRVVKAAESKGSNGWKEFNLQLSNGTDLQMSIHPGPGDIAVFTHTLGWEKVPAGDIQKAVDAGLTTVRVNLAAQSPEYISEKNFPYHQTSRRLLWLGRTLMGEWTAEMCLIAYRLKQQYPDKKITFNSYHDSAHAALFATLFTDKIAKVQLHNTFVSWVYDKKASPSTISMAAVVPGILVWGDASLAAALSPAECEWINPQDTAGKPAEAPTAEIGIYQKKLIRK